MKRAQISISDLGANPAEAVREAERLGIRGLAANKGDMKPLVDDLLGCSRLRVGHFRVIYREDSEAGQRVVRCPFC